MLTPPHEFDPITLVSAPIFVDNLESLEWSETADIVVVGFGGAGAVSAVQAQESGASVIIVDRFDGGGATALSGGVIYAGGTDVQREAGFEDSADNMYRYLKHEVEDVVGQDVLDEYCRGSQDCLDWLREHRLEFKGTFKDGRVAFPDEEVFLYYTGNEKLFADQTKTHPAPRGVRTVGDGLGGQHFYQGLREEALRLGAKFLPHNQASRLVIGGNGRVVGVEVLAMPENSPGYKRHRKLKARYDSMLRFVGGAQAAKAVRELSEIERKYGVTKLVRARKGVILATGGFMFNSEMVRQHSPKYVGSLPLGTVSCNGSGIQLGMSAGGAIDRMSSIAAWRHLSEPVAPGSLLQGLIVGADGKRFIAEDAYSATLGGAIAERKNGQAWVIMDRPLRCDVMRSIYANVGPKIIFQIPILLTLLFKTKKSKTLKELANAVGIDAENLFETVKISNQAVKDNNPDPHGKTEQYRRVIDHGPFYAMDIATDSKFAQAVTITLGGLVVDEASSLVLREDGKPIEGLYAVGRTAIGLPSNRYVSGLAIGDCIFSGRRAAKHATEKANLRANTMEAANSI